MNVKIATCKKDYRSNLSTCVCGSSMYLKSNADTSVIDYDEIITFMDSVSSKMTNVIATNVMSTASKNCHSKKKRLLYFAYNFITDHVTIDNYCYLLSLCKTKMH